MAIKHFFSIFPGIGKKTQEKLWKQGIHDWQAAKNLKSFPGLNTRLKQLKLSIEKMEQALENKDCVYLKRNIPSHLEWALYPDLKDSMLFLDIETTGLSPGYDHITTIAAYDGDNVFTFVCDENLEDFTEFVQEYDCLVTFYGKNFDVPFIQRDLGIKCPHFHIDLCFVFRALAITGGLKKIEQKFGVSRNALTGVDGYFAVKLWNDYKNTDNKQLLDILLAYNVEDVLHLQMLMPIAYNMQVEQRLLFEHPLVPPITPHPNPITIDEDLLEKLLN